MTRGEQIWANAITKIGFHRFPEEPLTELGKEIIAAIDDDDRSFKADLDAMEAYYSKERMR